MNQFKSVIALPLTSHISGFCLAVPNAFESDFLYYLFCSIFRNITKEKKKGKCNQSLSLRRKNINIKTMCCPLCFVFPY